MNKRILLIDDDPLVLRTFDKLLKHNGYEVISCANHREAVDAISIRDFDLIVSDIRMPGKNGVETVAMIQNLLMDSGKKDLPIIFITGYADLSQELQANFVGEILQKPVDNERLLTAVRDYL
ncbi:response regulator [Omnitrophica bacterium]|nr:response regulator [Candidatus Omnitrophota bacterium]